MSQIILTDHLMVTIRDMIQLLVLVGKGSFLSCVDVAYKPACCSFQRHLTSLTILYQLSPGTAEEESSYDDHFLIVVYRDV